MLTELLYELDLLRSSYFYHQARLEMTDKHVEVRQVMADIFERNYRCYGYRRIHASLSDQSVTISEKVVRRLMKQECLVAATSKRRRYGSYLGEISPAPDNLLNRDFSAEVPNEKWLTDITEFQIPAGKVYLSPMIDCFDGMVVAGQCRLRGLLWSAEDRDVLRAGLAHDDHRRIRDSVGRVHPLVQRGAYQALTRLPQPRRAPQELGNRCLTNPSFCPHPRWVRFKSATTAGPSTFQALRTKRCSAPSTARHSKTDCPCSAPPSRRSNRFLPLRKRRLKTSRSEQGIVRFTASTWPGLWRGGDIRTTATRLLCGHTKR